MFHNGYVMQQSEIAWRQCSRDHARHSDGAGQLCSRAARTPPDKGNTGLSAQESDNPATIILDLRHVTRYGSGMIRTIRHKGLKRLHEDDDPRGVIAEHAEKLRDILARLDAVQPWPIWTCRV